jgi:hypothetical protein
MGHLANRWNPPALVLPQIQSHRMPWEKPRFITWFEANVRGKFKQGDFVTRIETQPNVFQVPFYFEVMYVNELYYTIEFNQVCQEPSCIHIKGRSGEVLKRCPSELRQLTVEELQLVDLQNTQAQGFC